jgi:hypothetical protein
LRETVKTCESTAGQRAESPPSRPLTSDIDAASEIIRQYQNKGDTIKKIKNHGTRRLFNRDGTDSMKGSESQPSEHIGQEQQNKTESLAWPVIGLHGTANRHNSSNPEPFSMTL